MKFSPLLHTLLLLLTLCSCATQYDIAGNSSLDEVDGHMVYLRVNNGMVGNAGSIDSCRVVHGRFRFGGAVDSVVMAQMYMGKDILMPIVIENGELQVTIDPMGQAVKGGALNKRLYDFLQKRDRLENEMWQAEHECIRALRSGRANLHEARAKLRVRTNKLARQIEEAESRFIAENYDNALGPGYYIMLCDQQIFPTMTEQLQRIADKAPMEFLMNPYINHYLHVAGYDFSRRSRPRPSRR